jgi:hypothetical protein
MPSSALQRSLTSWDGNVQDLPLIGKGTSGLVFAIDERRVVKVSLGTPRSNEDIETERKIYQRFDQKFSVNPCPYILRCLDTENSRGIVLERWDETVRSRIRSKPAPSFQDVQQWAIQAAKGLGAVHDCGVIQGDGQDIQNLASILKFLC